MLRRRTRHRVQGRLPGKVHCRSLQGQLRGHLRCIRELHSQRLQRRGRRPYSSRFQNSCRIRILSRRCQNPLHPPDSPRTGPSAAIVHVCIAKAAFPRRVRDHWQLCSSKYSFRLHWFPLHQSYTTARKYHERVFAGHDEPRIRVIPALSVGIFVLVASPGPELQCQPLPLG